MKTFFFLIFCLFVSSCAHHSSVTRPMVIAHRGASGYLPEHTLAAVAMAHAWDVDYVEPDVVLTKDNIPIVLHDITLEGTTNVAEVFPRRARKDGKFYAIDFTLAEIRRLRTLERGRYPGRFTSNVKIFSLPTLEEYLLTLKGLNFSRKKNIGLYVEFKAPEFHAKAGKDIVKVAMDALKSGGFLEAGSNTIVQCFEPNTLKRIRQEYGPDLFLVQLIAMNSWDESSADYDAMVTQEGVASIAKYAQGIGPSILHLIDHKKLPSVEPTPLVERAHANGLKVHPFTHRSDALGDVFKTDKEMLDFLFKKLKVDGVFSDFSDVVIRYFDGTL